MIPQRNLSLLSNRLAQKGGRRIPEAVLERDYCLSWFLVGLLGTILRDTLAFKGGTAIKKCFIPDYRFSEDLDFTLRNDVSFEHIQEQFDQAFTYSQQASGIRLTISRIDRHPHENSHSFFIAYEGPLPGATGKEVKVDLYDLWHLVSHDFLKPGELIDAVRQKMRFRGKDLANTREILIKKEARLKKLWKTRLLYQMEELPEFDQVHRYVLRELRQAGFLGDINK